jgi:adenine-specific DNA methylase
MKTIKSLEPKIKMEQTLSQHKGELHNLTPSSSARILRTLSRKNAFYFFTSVGNYTGQSAMSLEEFANKIREVETTSLEFHLYRGDFEKWTDEVLEDNILTERISAVKLLEPVGNSLRDQLYFTVSKRLEELKSTE